MTALVADHTATTAPAPSTSRPLVLVVEDDHAAADLLQTALAEIGLPSERAVTGAQALHLLARVRPALVLLDLSLPDMHGETVGQAVRDRYGDEIPIIVISAFPRRDPRLAPLRALALLSKPFDLDDLLHLVVRCLPPTPRERGPA